MKPLYSLLFVVLWKLTGTASAATELGTWLEQQIGSIFNLPSAQPDWIVQQQISVNSSTRIDGNNVNLRLENRLILSSGTTLTLSRLRIVLDASVDDLIQSSLDADTSVLPLSRFIDTAALGSKYALEDVVIVLDNCTSLEFLQVKACQQRVSWSGPQVGPGFVGYSKWESPDLRVAAQLAMVTCGKYEASAQALLSSGMTWQNGTWSHLNSNASLGVVQHDPLPCAVVRVDSAAALSDAATVLQTAILPSVEGGYVVIRLAANVSTPVESWPHQGVLVHQNVTFIGDVNQKPEIDVHLNIDFVHIHQTTGTLTLADLIMNNMPHGPDSVYPMSMLVGAVWCVNFNRPAANRSLLIMTGVRLIVPQDLFIYLSYWAGIQTSPIPVVQAQADWLKDNIYFAQQVAEADDNKLVFVRRDGQGTLWINSSLSNQPYHAKRLMSETGVMALVPGVDFMPFVNVTSIYNASHLAKNMMNPKTQHLVLMYSMQLNSSAIQNALNRAANLTQGNTTEGMTTPPRCMPGVTLPMNKGVVLVGRAGRTIILDFGMCSSSVNISLDRGTRLTMQRMVLTGLPPTTPDKVVVAPVLRNFTIRLWPFNIPSGQVGVRLQNVTMLVSKTELRAVQQVMDMQYRWPGDEESTSGVRPPLSGAQVAAVKPALVLAEAEAATSTSVFFTNIAFGSVDGGQVLCSSSLPEPTTFEFTPPAELMLGEEALALPGPEQPSSSSGLKGWEKGVIGACAAVGGLLLIGLAVWGWTRSKSRATAANLTPMATEDGADSGDVHLEMEPSSAQTSKLNGWPSNSNHMSTSGANGCTNSRNSEPPSTQTVAGLTTRMSGVSANAEVAALVAYKTASNVGADFSTSWTETPHSQTGTNSGSAARCGTTATPAPTPAGQSMASGKSTHIKKLDGGLAQGLESEAPDQELHELITQQAGLTGIDMQQVEIEDLVGQGSFGVVYRGKWRNMTVAIKALMFQDAGSAKRVRQRAITEAAINTLLTHTNIVNTYAYDLRPVEANGLPDHKLAAHWKLYIIQEFCDSGSLSQAIDAGFFIDQDTGARKLDHILEIGSDIARGVAYIHERQVVHGDLSSGNIMLRSEPRCSCGRQAKVCDFGLSRFLEGPEQSHISNARQGTPFYIAPEVLKQGIISKEADIFSFGVLLWEMYTGRPPWRDPAVNKNNLEYSTFKYKLPAGTPHQFEAIVYACLFPVAKVRPQFVAVLSAIAQLQEAMKRPGGLDDPRSGTGSGDMAATGSNGDKTSQGSHTTPLPPSVVQTLQLGVGQSGSGKFNRSSPISPVTPAGTLAAATGGPQPGLAAAPSLQAGGAVQTAMGPGGVDQSLVMPDSIDMQLPERCYQPVLNTSVAGNAGSFCLPASMDTRPTTPAPGLSPVLETGAEGEACAQAGSSQV